MFKVHLLDPDESRWSTADNPSKSKSYKTSQLAAAICYQPTLKMAVDKAKNIDINGKVWPSGHLTTTQHARNHMTFLLDNIPISLVTFGLHLAHPFYNTSQRSGRYCTDMFNTDYNWLCQLFISKFTNIPAKSPEAVKLCKWVDEGVTYFKHALPGVTAKVLAEIKRTRPNYRGNYDTLALKMAQEQLRGIISTIFPTGLAYTINVSTLVGMAETAWNEPLRALLLRMVAVANLRGLVSPDIVANKHKNLMDWVPAFDSYSAYGVNTPMVKLQQPGPYGGTNFLRMTDRLDKIQCNTPVNRLPFSPKTNFITDEVSTTLYSSVEVSVATFGQDQRHRTISRGNPSVTGGMYVSPILDADHGQFFVDHMGEYLEMAKGQTADLIHFIPYGAVVSYAKESEIRAFHHEMHKRLCWNAQDEIRLLAEGTVRGISPTNSAVFGPPCQSEGKCYEKTPCGRMTKKSAQEE